MFESKIAFSLENCITNRYELEAFVDDHLNIYKEVVLKLKHSRKGTLENVPINFVINSLTR